MKYWPQFVAILMLAACHPPEPPTKQFEIIHFDTQGEILGRYETEWWSMVGNRLQFNQKEKTVVLDSGTYIIIHK